MAEEKIAETSPDVEIFPPTYVDRRESVEDEITRARQIQQRVPPLRWMRKGEEWLDNRLGMLPSTFTYGARITRRIHGPDVHVLV